MPVNDAINDYVRSISESAQRSPDLNSFLLRVLTEITSELNADGGSIFLADRTERNLFLGATTGLVGGIRKNDVVYRTGEGLTGWVAESRKPIYLHNDEVRSNRRWLGKFSEFTLKEQASLAIVPMIWFGGQLLGVIRCVWSTPMSDLQGDRVKERLRLSTSLITPYVAAFSSEIERINTIERITHELKSSLVAIKNSLQMVVHKETSLSESSQDRLNDTVQLCDMLMTSVETKSLAVGKEMTVRKTHCLLFEDVIMPVTRMLKFSFDRRKLDLKISPAIQRRPRVFTDLQLFRLVVFNLLDNALKYSPPGTNVDIEGTPNNSHFELAFSNYGPGIIEEERDKIFLKRHRSSTAISKNVAGFGMGLYICRVIMERLGGDIRLTNLHNPTTFAVSIPTEQHEK